MRQKTKSKFFRNSSEHLAFQHCLVWLWNKEMIINRECQIPAQVQQALIKCTDCSKNQPCTAMAKLAASIPSAATFTTSAAPSSAARLPEVSVLSDCTAASTASSAKSEHTPCFSRQQNESKPSSKSSSKRQCVYCDATQHNSIECPLIPASFKQDLPNFLNKGFKTNGSLSNHLIQVPIRRVTVTEIPGDGNCLFSAMAVGLQCHVHKNPVPDMTRRAAWGRINRSKFIQRLKEMLEEGFQFDADSSEPLSLALALEVCTSMSTEVYFQHMTEVGGPETWGGHFEVAVLSLRWKVKTHIFFLREVSHGQQVYQLAHSSGKPTDVNRIITIAWNGSHYDTIQLSPSDLAKLP